MYLLKKKDVALDNQSKVDIAFISGFWGAICLVLIIMFA